SHVTTDSAARIKRGARLFCLVAGAGIMQSIWQKHVIICLSLGLAAIPVYFLDKVATGSAGGNWIALDFRGLLFWTYLVLLAIDVVVSSSAILLFPKSRILRIHVASFVLSIILLVAGFIVYSQLLRAESISTTVAKCVLKKSRISIH